MNMTRTEENLLIMLDPSGHLGDGTWKLIHTNKINDISKLHKFVLVFSRRDLIRYFLCLLEIKLSGKNKCVRKILYINDGLLCCLFSADNTIGYRAFARRHLSAPSGIRRRILKLLPPILQAEQFYIAIEQPLDAERIKGHEQLDNLDFMFYSNAPGKLLLTNSETFTNGTGLIFKTTSVPDYVDNLDREYEAVCLVSKNLQNPGLVPDVGVKLRVNSRCYYPEAYLSGEDLRSMLRNAGKSSSHHEAVHFLDRLDNWYTLYHASFQAVKRSLSSLYKHLLKYYELNIINCDVVTIVKYAGEFLAETGSGHGGVVPVLAHNDLWPGNFIVNGDRLTAIDWERATPERAPIFDYFWMIISAVMEYRVGQNGVQDYSVAFRQFLRKDDEVCAHAFSKLEIFLESLGFGKQTFSQFILLFLMEWSIQGVSALGKLTDMDRLAQGELIAFSRDHPEILYGKTSSGFIASP